jgi:hypothetical protein
MQKPIGITVPDHWSTSYGSARVIAVAGYTRLCILLRWRATGALVRPCRPHAVASSLTAASHRSARVHQAPLPVPHGSVSTGGGELGECSYPPLLASRGARSRYSYASTVFWMYTLWRTSRRWERSTAVQDTGTRKSEGMDRLMLISDFL